MNRRATIAGGSQFPEFSPQAKAQAASLRAQAALYMQADSVIRNRTARGQTVTDRGAAGTTAAPLAHYVWDGTSRVPMSTCRGASAGDAAFAADDDGPGCRCW